MRAEGTAELDLRGADVAALSAARHWLAAELVCLSADAREDALLAAGELLANAYDHGGGPRALRVAVSQVGSVTTAVVEVDDPSAATPVPGVSRLGPDRGRGMLVVARTSQAWGVRPGTSGKTVWFRVVERS